jgi:hypothetical protein
VQPAQIIARFTKVAPKASRGRRLTPSLIRRRPVAQPQVVGGVAETWTIGYLIDVIFTRDPWLHRVDIARASGARNTLTADHDGVIVDDVVREWSHRHGQPFTLNLTGPAGGSWSIGSDGPQLSLDAIDFCRSVSGRAPADGLLATQVPF